MKILIAGNKNYGLANSLYKIYNDAKFVSRTTDFNLGKADIREAVAELSLEYDIFIAVSALGNFNPTLLVESIIKRWWETNRKG